MRVVASRPAVRAVAGDPGPLTITTITSEIKLRAQDGIVRGYDHSNKCVRGETCVVGGS